MFVEKPENKIIIEGSSDFIEAVVDGNPFPTVTWLKGTRECTDGPKFTCECDPSTGIVGLTIKKAKSDDEAKYTLRLQNEGGEEQATFSVFVKCKIFFSFSEEAIVNYRFNANLSLSLFFVLMNSIE